MASMTARPSRVDLSATVVTTVLVAALLVGCAPGAASTTGCPAFQAWEDRDFPTDLTSPTNGPRYLTFLATVADEAPPVADDAEVVLRAAQAIHDAWVAAGGPDGPGGETERATTLTRELWTPEVEAAAARVRDYGAETCGVTAP